MERTLRFGPPRCNPGVAQRALHVDVDLGRMDRPALIGSNRIAYPDV
jgi:hypothetical protein